ncbi:VOC family protein [Janibacter anophelis]|uniref:VOC family protein n=1 Tax=Janibacter anophelis TaxID=319054 RepID=UPI000DEEB469|nr:VOC family protein [Janibacter anophelis]
MASKLNPYLNFDGNAREAMEFYQSVLGGELLVHTFGESMPDAGDLADQVMHASLITEAGYTIFASDPPPGMPVTSGTNITVSISGDDTEQLRSYWAGLTAGAEITMPLEMQMWGDEYGAFTDRYGIPWMVNISGS